MCAEILIASCIHHTVRVYGFYKVDEAAAIIRSYLAHPSCSLQTLSLRSADVDDNECCCLMEAISRNQSLTKLDVSGACIVSCLVVSLSWW